MGSTSIVNKQEGWKSKIFLGYGGSKKLAVNNSYPLQRIDEIIDDLDTLGISVLFT